MKQPGDPMRRYETAMKEGHAGSVTAEGVALIRAAESVKPENERICYDPYAIHFIPPETLARIRNISDGQREAERVAYDREFPGQRNSIAARVRFFDEVVQDEISRGTRQIVIIGAGYDSRAYRIVGIEAARVFELDRPQLQEEKKSKVIGIFGALPPHVTYLPVDLAGGGLSAVLESAGFERTRRTLVIMEGLLYYLPPSLVRQLLTDIAGIAAVGSSILFDCHDQSVADGTHPSEIARNLRRHVEAVGEPFLFGIPGEGVEAFLGGFGYTNIRCITSQEYLRQVSGEFTGRTTHGLTMLCQAEVGERSMAGGPPAKIYQETLDPKEK